MLTHFIKRDFKDLKLGWGIVGGIVFLALAAIPFSPKEGVFIIAAVIGYTLFFMTLIPLNQVLGSHWRNQHVMSRYYLLSLPVPRNELFKIQQIRLLIYGLPITLFAIITPMFWLAVPEIWFLLFTLFYSILVGVTIIFFIQLMILFNLFMENFSSHVNQQERFWQGIISFGIFAAFYGIILVAWHPYLGILSRIKRDSFDFFKEWSSAFPLILLGLCLISGVTFFLYKFNKKNWTNS